MENTFKIESTDFVPRLLNFRVQNYSDSRPILRPGPKKLSVLPGEKHPLYIPVVQQLTIYKCYVRATMRYTLQLIINVLYLLRNSNWQIIRII